MAASHLACNGRLCRPAESFLADDYGEIRRIPQRVTRNGRPYWYDAYRVGGVSKKRYLGEDSKELLGRIAGWEELVEDRRTRGRLRAQLMKVLCGEGVTPIDRQTGAVLTALARSRAFRVGGVFVGTAAFRLYEGELGVIFSTAGVAQTNDIDVASFEPLSFAMEEKAEPQMASALSELDFEQVPSIRPGRSWKLRNLRSEMLVEFLSHRHSRTRRAW